MRRKEMDGTDYMPGLEHELHKNQHDLVNDLLSPHVRLPETLGAKHKIVAKMPAYQHDAQPVQARGRICWNDAYKFQPHGPTYIDPVPDPGLGGGH